MPKKTTDVSLAPVDKYEERPVATRADEETVAAEARFLIPPQNPDYHKDHPTLDTNGPEHDPEVQAELRAQEAKKIDKTAKAVVKDQEQQAEG